LAPQTEASIAVAREFNANIRKLAERLDDVGDGDETEYGFLCECGCGKAIALPLAAFVAGGAWLATHNQQPVPAAASGPQPASKAGG
jgi:hypothetical protein